MLWVLFAALVVLWAAGLLTANPLGGALHLFLVAAVVVLLVALAQRRIPT